MKKIFRSNGKLLLTSEYFVLDGAIALALPTKKGQSLTVCSNDSNLLNWRSYNDQNNTWFEAEIGYNFKYCITNNNQVANTLINFLKECMLINTSFSPFGSIVETFLEFPTDWGLGSSSTLITNLAKWAKIDPFQLLRNSFSGSGYDIANALYDTPILYSLLDNGTPNIDNVIFNPSYKDKIYFIHLNKKQNSREGINFYNNLTIDKDIVINKLNKLTNTILTENNLFMFNNHIVKHEEIISSVLNIPTVKSKLFDDYGGAIKSLGAWGGDFMMVTFVEGMFDYFINKGYSTIISYDEMIK